MTHRSGFTLIELVITITVMAALLTLTVVSLRSSQATARDEERTTDVTAIVQALEAYYMGDFDPATTGSNPLYAKGYYPPTAYFSNQQTILNTLRDLNAVALYAPGKSTSGTPSLVGATSTASQTPAIDAYIYQPLKTDGTLCTQGQSSASYTLDSCRKFNLYYRLETTNQVQTITSKNQ